MKLNDLLLNTVTDYQYGEITNVEKFQHDGFPEWFTHTNKKDVEHIISTLDECTIRYRIKGENFDRLLFFGICSPVLYSDGVIKYNKRDVMRESEDKSLK